MAEIQRRILFKKLSKPAYKCIDSATGFCRRRGNPYVELVHWFHELLDLPDSDLHRIIQHYELDAGTIDADIVDALDMLPRGHTSITDLSSHIETAMERGWITASLMYGEAQVRTGHLIVAILSDRTLRNVLLDISGEFRKVTAEALADRLAEITAGSPEARRQVTHDSGTPIAGDEAPVTGDQGALARFTSDLTAAARAGEIDRIVGRDQEIRQIVDILLRRRQNNPILTGEAGVGKTAVVEGFAIRIASGDVPPQLKDVELRILDVGLLQAGASMKGEFENRLREVIDAVHASPRPIILFIDEAHTLVGAGGTAGTGDAANLLKPALARGTLRTIAATTWAEYKKYIEKDPALTRRFQVVQIDEPDVEKAVLMLRGVASTMEQHHKVQILDEALEAAVNLSHRYIPARQLPDKAVSLLDTSCARVAVSQHAVPGAIDDSRKRIDALDTELSIIAREKAIGIDATARENDVVQSLDAERSRLAELEDAWEREKALVEEILGLRERLRSDTLLATELEAVSESSEDEEQQDSEKESRLTSEERQDLLNRLRTLQGQLGELQGEAPLILPSVDRQCVGSVVADWTGIPVGRMMRDEVTTIMELAERMGRRVIGQEHAHDMIAKRVQTSRANLDNPDKPVGVFMLAGPSGVGKTETALALAELLYGGEHNVITINMSEFQEAHTVSTLKGAPPGYVGYGEGGVLTEAVRRKPYSVVLLDEVEKAHSDVHEIFFQVFDKGVMEDGEGRRIDFKNTLILLTTNVGSELIISMCRDPELTPEPEALSNALRPELLKVFPAALLGRMVVIPYHPLTDEIMGEIVKLQFGRIQRRIQNNHGIALDYDDDVVKLVTERCKEVESGGRMIDAILTNTVLPAISREILVRGMEDSSVSRIRVEREGSDFGFSFVA